MGWGAWDGTEWDGWSIQQLHHAAPPRAGGLCCLQSLHHEGRGEAGRGRKRGLKSLLAGKSLDFISPFQCEFFAVFHSDITLRFSIASEFLPINGKTINVHLEK